MERPTDAEGARYSPGWLMAAAAIDREITPRQVGPEALSRADIHALRERVSILTDRVADNDTRFGGIVDVHVRGAVHTVDSPYPSGHPSKPLSAGQLAAKSRSALGTAMDEHRATQLHELIAGFATGSVRELNAGIRSALRR